MRDLKWYATAAAAHDPDRGDAVVGEPSGWFDAEYDNLRAALATALATDPTLAIQMTTSTWRFWVNRGLIAEGARWLTLALNACPDRSALRARALAAKSVMLIRQAKSSELITIGDEIVDLLNEHGDPGERAHGYHQRALLAFMAGDWGLAQTQSDEALRVALEFPAVTASAQHFAARKGVTRSKQPVRGSTPHSRLSTACRLIRRLSSLPCRWAGQSMSVVIRPCPSSRRLCCLVAGLVRSRLPDMKLAMAFTERMAGNLTAAFALIDDAYARLRDVDDRYGQAYALSQRGHALRWIGQYDEAGRSLQESESLRRELRDRRESALALAGRALNAASAGAADLARTLGRRSIALMEESGDIAGIAATEVNLADAEVLLADLPEALIWLDRALAFYPVPGGHRSLGWVHLLRAHVLQQLADLESSTRSAAAAQEVFAQLGEGHGLIAAQRICKEDLPSLPA